MKTTKTSIATFLAVVCTLFMVSCSSDDDNSGENGYPKEVAVTYKVTSAAAGTLTLVQYKNETGGSTDVANAALPYTKTFNRTVNKGDILGVAYGNSTSQTVKLEILVDNEVVKTQEFTSTSGAIIYQFN